MPYLQCDGVKLFFNVYGTGPTVLLSHGYSATSNMWRGQVKALEGFRLITWDMCGHGQSDSPEDHEQYSEAHTVADMVALLDHVGAEQAVIGGLSLGGYMSLAFHAAQPARTRALMLFDTGPGFRNELARETWNKTAAARAEAFDRNGLASLGQGDEVHAEEHRSARGLALAARGMLAQHDSHVIDSLPTVRVPTLALVGADDTPFLIGTQYMARKIPGATHVILPDAGHASNLNQPAAFNAAMLTFLQTLPAQQ